MRTKPPTANRTSKNVALELGFRRCAQDLRMLLLTTPLGWLLMGWICWDRVPLQQLAWWLGGFAISWMVALLLLTLLLRLPSPQRRRHGWMLFGAAALDGMAWASMVPLLLRDSGSDALLPWLIVVLCGVAALTAPIYVSYVRAHSAYLGGLFGVLLGHTLWRFPDLPHLGITLGLILGLVLLTWHMRRIGHSAEEAMRLQLKNTAKNERLAGLLRVARRDAETDALTGLANRRQLDSTLSSRWQAGGLNDRRDRPLSVLMLDLDHFKRVNDTHGHDVGDQILKAFAVRTSKQLRKPDLFARYGGEEFTVLLPGTDAPKAMLIAERVRAAIAGMPLIAEPPVPITVSIGVAQRQPNESTESLLARADAALYAAKQGGRNRVTLAE
ncbi:diguanylate cyclase [Hylemonella gracilis str. Niagara R]|uniref:diguanylate cyclase n=1 Tax=Hylemonella gracilis str. Niagara R TaxID=1458275 RepID=A0A016XG12_9BURK|nr:GGDEF domain-containing protein [Hylemonella gracilis]EYC50133.1 diguanylate cyclase [Hylemonella gracilis str. Niagara R]